MYLEKINSPKDIKKLSIDELKELIVELRAHLLKRLSEKGGHIGPNLGSLEFTVALHYVFDSPKDKIVFDVSHQTYVHKMLTGRKDAFMIPEKYSSVTGYTSPKESEHDFFTIGHTSTSISLACGLAKARNLKGDNENIIAVIGDGSLSGGEAYEGLNNVFELDSNMIVVINDNNQNPLLKIMEVFTRIFLNSEKQKEKLKIIFLKPWDLIISMLMKEMILKN